jgi:hypothetical protein
MTIQSDAHLLSLERAQDLLQAVFLGLLRVVAVTFFAVHSCHIGPKVLNWNFWVPIVSSGLIQI